MANFNTTGLWALIAIDYKGYPALIKYGPVEWWNGIMMSDGFIDVFDAKLPKKAGVYWWHGSYISTDDSSEWIGKWTWQCFDGDEIEGKI